MRQNKTTYLRSFINKHKAKKNKKERNKNKKISGTQRESERQACMDDACVDKAVSYLKLLKDKIKNFKVQKARIATSKKQALGKAKKSGLWASLISKLVLAGGGNSSALTCNGATGPGADNLAALYTELTGCEANVNMSCSTELPEYNSTMEGMCSDYIKTFETLTSAAMDAEGAKACDMWMEPDLAMVADDVRSCDISKDNSMFTAYKSKCIKTFGACRKAEDKASQAITVCSSSNSKTEILAAITAGVANQAAAADLSKKIAAVTTAPPPRATTSCADFTSAVTDVTKKTMDGPLLSGLDAMLKDATAMDVSPCSTTEIPILESAGAAFMMAADGIGAAISVKQMELEVMTGSTVSTMVSTGAPRYFGLSFGHRMS